MEGRNKNERSFALNVLYEGANSKLDVEDAGGTAGTGDGG